MNSADLPMRIIPAGDPIWNAAQITIAVAVIVSAPWAWLLYDERATSEQLLIEATARHARVERLTIQYSTGAKASVEIKEAR